MHQLLKARACAELGKLFQLAVDGVPALTMPSKAIDLVWHGMLHNREAYERFSIEACGRVVEHRSSRGAGPVTWVAEYEGRFGKLDPIWFTDDKSMLDTDAYDQYLATGQFKASWDCSPGDGE
ncbi:MAG: hypothetical protein ACRDZO_01520 [Egibacteraceae bacterium]